MIDNLNLHLMHGTRRIYDTHWAEQGKTVHQDPFCRLYRLFRGRIILETAEDRFELTPGSYYLIPDNTPARYRTLGELELSWLHFTCTIYGALSLFDHLGPLLSLAVDPEEADSDRMMQLCRTQTRDSLSRTLQMDGWFRTLIGRLLESGKGDMSLSEEQEMSARRFLPVLAYMERNLKKAIRLEELASLVQLHPTYFSNQFSHRFGLSPLQYFIRRRLLKAIELMADPLKTLEVIALETGFRDPFYFTRTFKKVFGITPSLYRKRL